MQRLSQSPAHDVASSSSHKRLVLVSLNRKQSRLLARHSKRLHNVVSLAATQSAVPALTSVRVVERTDTDTLKPLPKAVESVADDPSIHNPLERMERLGTGWFGAIVEYEGVLVEDTAEYHQKAWLAVADEFGLPRPLGHLFRRIKGVRNELVVQTIFNWTRNPSTATKIARRKEEVYEEMLGGLSPAAFPESKQFLDTLKRNKIPVALACALPETKVRAGLQHLGLTNYMDAVVTAEDSGAPEVEYYYMYASTLLQRPHMRCVVVGDSNKSVEAARELGMKSVVVTNGKPVWDYAGADLVVRSLSQVSFFNLKKLFSNEELVEPQLQLEMELEEDTSW